MRVLPMVTLRNSKPSSRKCAAGQNATSHSRAGWISRDRSSRRLLKSHFHRSLSPSVVRVIRNLAVSHQPLRSKWCGPVFCTVWLPTSILLKDRDSPDYYYNFYWKRALRILPLYLGSLLVAWLWFGESAAGVIISVFFLANSSRAFYVALSGPYWTLALKNSST